MRPAHLQFTSGLVVVLIALSLVLSGCGGGGDEATTVSGTVLDAGSLTAVEGAAIAAGGSDATTDSTGFFTLTSISAGQQSIIIAADGYTTQSVPVGAGSGDKSVGTVYLVPAPLTGFGNISGVITEAGTLISGAVVRAGGRTARTRANGTYTIYNVPAGVQTVLATSSDGTTGGTTSVTVVSLGTVTANIPLTAQPPAPPSTD